MSHHRDLQTLQRRRLRWRLTRQKCSRLGSGRRCREGLPCSALECEVSQGAQGSAAQVELVPTGGVSLTTAAEFLEAARWRWAWAATCRQQGIRAGKPEALLRTPASTWRSSQTIADGSGELQDGGTMKALLLRQAGDAVIETVDDPKPVAMKSCSRCGGWFLRKRLEFLSRQKSMIAYRAFWP